MKRYGGLNELNFTYIAIAAILGLAILGYGFLNYLSGQNELQLKKQEVENQSVLENKRQEYYQICTSEAEAAAIKLLKDKVAILEKTGGTASTLRTFREAAEQDLYLKEDYASLYDNCLGRYGLK